MSKDEGGGDKENEKKRNLKNKRKPVEKVRERILLRTKRKLIELDKHNRKEQRRRKKKTPSKIKKKSNPLKNNK